MVEPVPVTDREYAFRTKFNMRDRVCIDGDASIVGVVTGVCWQDGPGHTVEVSWLHNGQMHKDWVSHWRLTHVV